MFSNKSFVNNLTGPSKLYWVNDALVKVVSVFIVTFPSFHFRSFESAINLHYYLVNF